MATFLDVEQLVDQFLAEMPQGQFAADRADSSDYTKRSISSSDIRSQMTCVASLYSNMNQVYLNKFASYTDAVGLARLEKDYFPYAVDTTQSFSTRQANLLAKIRSEGGISFAAIDQLIHSILDPVGLPFQIIRWSGGLGGTWILGVSSLGFDTYLAAGDPLLGANQNDPLDCDLDYAGAGITAAQLALIQKTAYTYEVRIQGTASSGVLAQLDQALTEAEGAARTHVIYNNFTGPDFSPD